MCECVCARASVFVTADNRILSIVYNRLLTTSTSLLFAYLGYRVWPLPSSESQGQAAVFFLLPLPALQQILKALLPRSPGQECIHLPGLYSSRPSPEDCSIASCQSTDLPYSPRCVNIWQRPVSLDPRGTCRPVTCAPATQAVLLFLNVTNSRHFLKAQ